MSNPDPVLPQTTASGQEFRRSWRIVVAALAGSTFGVNGFSYASFTVLVNPLALAFGRPLSAVNGWVTCLFLGNTLASPVVGMLADKFGARRVALISLTLFILTWAVAGTMVPHLWLLYLVAVAAGCIGTGAGPLTYGRIIITWFDAGRGAALGFMSAGIGLSYLFGPRVLQWVVDSNGWRIGFFFIAAMHLLPLPFIAGWLHERREKAVPGSPPLETGLGVREVLRMPAFWCAAAAVLLYGLCAGGVTVNLVPFLSDSGFSRARAATYMGMLGIFSMTGRVVTGFVIDRRHVAVVCALIFLTEASAFAIFGFFGGRFAIAAMVVTGFAFGGEVSCVSYLIARYFGVRHFGANSGLFSIVTGIGVSAGPLWFSLLREHSGAYRAPFFVSAGLAAAAAACFYALRLYPFFVDRRLASG